MAMDMPPPSPRTEKRRLTGTTEDLEALASPSKRGTPTSRSFFSTGPDVPRTPTDVSWIREQAGTTPRALDRDFLGASPASEVSGGGGSGGTCSAGNTRGASNGTLGAATGFTTRGKMYNRRTWTKEENEQLQEGMAALGGPNAEFGRNEWNAIAHDFLKDSRTGTQCATHWKMVLKPALLKGVWSNEEDSVIYDCVARGVSDWSEIASFLPKRKAKHCRERWTNHLDPTISKDEWSAAEEAQLLSAVEANGTNWTNISCLLPGRSESVVQEHWNAIIFRNAASAGGVRRGRSRTADASAAASAARGRARASALPVEPESNLLAGRNDGGEPGGVEGGRAEQAVTLSERERALMDHAFKTGLSATGADGGAGGAVAPPAPVNLIGTTSKGGGGEPLSLSMEEDDLFGPLTAALLKSAGSGSAGCSPANMPPPSPTTSPMKLAKQLHPDYTAIGDQLGDGWGVDDDPALADLYRSLDNIGESLFNEDTFELSFDFDSVDKPSPSCGGGGGGANQSNSSKGWDHLLGRQEKEVSPFRRAAAKAAATLEQRLSPAKRNPQTQRNLEEACARAAAAATAAAQAAALAANPSAAAQTTGPRVKQGFLRRLFSVDTKPGKQFRTPFNTVRGCLSEANVPPSPPPPPPTASPPARPSSPAGRRLGGENQAPRRGRQPLSVALFTQVSRSTDGGEHGKDIVAPTLKHGKAEVKIPPPQAGVPLSAVPASRFN